MDCLCSVCFSVMRHHLCDWLWSVCLSVSCLCPLGVVSSSPSAPLSLCCVAWRCVLFCSSKSAAEISERRRQINKQLAHVAIINTHNPNFIALSSSPFDQAQNIPTAHTTTEEEETDALLIPTNHVTLSLSSPSALSPSSSSTTSHFHSSSTSSTPPHSRSSSPLPAPLRLLSAVVPQSVSSLPWYQRLMRRSLSNHERQRAQRSLSTSLPSSTASASSPLYTALNISSTIGGGSSNSSSGSAPRDRESAALDGGAEDDPAMDTLLKKV